MDTSLKCTRKSLKNTSNLTKSGKGGKKKREYRTLITSTKQSLILLKVEN